MGRFLFPAWKRDFSTGFPHLFQVFSTAYTAFSHRVIHRAEKEQKRLLSFRRIYPHIFHSFSPEQAGKSTAFHRLFHRKMKE